MRAVTAVVLLLTGAVALSAQGSGPLCYHARPKPDCGAFLLTNFGAYLMVGKDDWGDMSLGVEIGGIPGAVFTGLSTLGTYLLFLAVASSD